VHDPATKESAPLPDFQAIFEACPTGLLLVNQRGRIERANPEAARVFGASVEELESLSVEALVPASYRSAHRGYRAGHGRDGAQLTRMSFGSTVPGLRRDGSTVLLKISLSYLDAERGSVLVTLVDVSQSASVERQLIRSQRAEQRRLALLDQTSDLVLAAEADGSIWYLNPRGQALLGLEPDEVSGRSVMELLIGEHQRQFAETLLPRAIAEGRTGALLRFVTAGGEQLTLECSLFIPRAADGALDCVGLIGRNVTERRALEERLRQHRYELFQMLEQLPQGVFVVDREGAPFFANHEAQRLLRRSAEVDRGGRLAETYQLVRRGTDEPYPEEALPVVRVLAGEGVVTCDDVEILHGDQRIPIEVRAAPIFSDDGELRFALALFSDVSERLAQEEERLQGERLESAEQLAAHITRHLSAPLQQISDELSELRGIIGIDHKAAG
jgi:PAS domain S-box-containing protein